MVIIQYILEGIGILTCVWMLVKSVLWINRLREEVKEVKHCKERIKELETDLFSIISQRDNLKALLEKTETESYYSRFEPYR